MRVYRDGAQFEHDRAGGTGGTQGDGDHGRKERKID